MSVRLDVRAARAAVSELLRPTPLVHSERLSRRWGSDVHLKLESLQPTGSFKVRGAAVRMTLLGARERRAGVVACSSGNHGRAVAWVARRLGVRATICVPRWVDPGKRAAMEDDGAEVVLAGQTYDDAEDEAHRIARERGAVLVHPFDDPHVAAGQGTLLPEVLEALPSCVAVVLPLSGGGLAGGVAATARLCGSRVRIVAASARRARVMWESLRSGKPVDLAEEETLAEALAGGIGRPNRITLDLVREHVDGHVVVNERAIAEAMRFAVQHLGLVVEGGGAVGLAALLEGGLAQVCSPDAGPVVIVISGGNVAPERLVEVLRGRSDTTD